jgi:hypothetical protein
LQVEDSTVQISIDVGVRVGVALVASEGSSDPIRISHIRFMDSKGLDLGGTRFQQTIQIAWQEAEEQIDSAVNGIPVDPIILSRTILSS